jgi:hypothetical protein
MKNQVKYSLATALLLVPALLPTAAAADDAAFDQLAQTYRGATLQTATWKNALLPMATGDTPAEASSADAQFMRAIAYYTRDMLDRAGWVNPYAPAPGYASGNYLLAVRIGSGVTLTAHV